MRRPAPGTQMAGYAMLVAVVVVSWAWRFAGRGSVVPLDTLTYFLPLYEATAERLANGVLPVWNPYQLAGIPWIGTVQAGVFYPGHLLYLVLPLNLAFLASNLLHLLLVAVATAVFVRRLGLGAASAFLAAVVMTLRGFVPMSQPAPNQLEAYAWLPVGAIACVGVVERGGRRAVALLAIATAMSLLAGYPQRTVHLAYAWATLAVAVAVDARLDVRACAAAAARVGGALVLGAMLAAVQMLPALELSVLGVRAPAELTEEAMFAVTSTLTPALLTLRLRAIMGGPLSFGVAALAMIPAALAAPRRRAVAVWAVALTVTTALFSLGDLTPAFALYRVLPALAWFRDPSRILALTEFGVAVAAAFGLEAIVGRRDRAPSRVAIALGAIGLTTVVWLAGDGWAPPDAWTEIRVRAAVAAGALALAVAGTRVPRAAATAALVGLLLFEASTTPWAGFRLPYTAADVAPLRANAGPLGRLAATAGHDRVWRYGGPTILQPAYMLKLATLDRFRAINDYEPLNLRRQATFFTYFTDGNTVPQRRPWLFPGTILLLDPLPDEPPPAERRRLIDLLATRYLVLPPGLRMGDRGVAAFLDAGGWREVDLGLGAQFKTFENPRPLPRAFVTYRTRRAPSSPDDLLREISRPDFDPLAESFVEGEPLAAGPDAPRGHAVAFVRDGESEVELDATLERPGLVVLADTFYPGWRATVDGRPAPVLATNHLFRGVPVDAGAHRVRFVYAPTSLMLGALGTLLGVAVCLWLVRR